MIYQIPLLLVLNKAIRHTCVDDFHGTTYSLTKNRSSEKHHQTVVLFKNSRKKKTDRRQEKDEKVARMEFYLENTFY